MPMVDTLPFSPAMPYWSREAPLTSTTPVKSKSSAWKAGDTTASGGVSAPWSESGAGSESAASASGGLNSPAALQVSLMRTVSRAPLSVSQPSRSARRRSPPGIWKKCPPEGSEPSSRSGS